MDFAYEVFPKVFSVGTYANVSVRGLHRDKVFKPYHNYSIHFFSIINKNEKGDLIIRADEKGWLKFRIFLQTKGEYLIDVYDEENRGKEENREKILTTIHIFAVDPDLARRKAYRGDLHLHTVYSDGLKTPIQMAVMGKKLGFDFIAITDHNKHFPSLEAIEEARKMNLNLLIFAGEEISAYGEKEERMHLLSYGASKGVVPERNNKKLYEKEYQDIFNELKDKNLIQGLSREIYANVMWYVKKVHQFGGYAFIAHPFWIMENARYFHIDRLVYDQLLEDNLVDGVEIPGGCLPGENLLAITEYYDKTAKGKKIPIINSSDSHDYGHIYGDFWTMVFAEKLEKEDIFQAILDLKSVACVHHPDENFTALDSFDFAPPGNIYQDTFDLKSRAYIHHPYENFIAIGPFELVEYAYFLQREFFPLHNKICELEGKLSMRILEGKDKYGQELVNLRKELDDLYGKFWA